MKTSEKYLFMAIIAELVEVSGLSPMYTGYSIFVVYNDLRFEIFPNFGKNSFGIKVYDPHSDLCAYSGEYELDNVTDFTAVLEHVISEGKVYQEDMPF